MKNSILIIALLLSLMISCEEDTKEYYSNPIVKIDQNLEYSYNDFELYDSSTHMLYFKCNQPELVNPNLSGFIVYADTIKIYQGSYWSVFLSSLPSVPFIWKNPFFYPDYVMRFEFIGSGTDPRNDYRLITAFKNQNLLHSGLIGEIKEIVINGSQLVFSFTVTNKDQSDLLILDPEKMGQNLFHYFTNAPVFYNISQKKVFEYGFDYEAPSPHNAWSPSWLTELKSGDSRNFTFNYTINSQFSTGDYKISFEFPGLSSQIQRDQLYQDNKRIWLGDITMKKYLRIQ